MVAIFKAALNSGAFIGGPAVEAFEKQFAEFSQADHCVGVGSGTDALRFAFMAAHIGPGDAIVTAAHTFIATSEAISQTGARPYFVDVDSKTYNMDPIKLRDFLANKCSRNSAGQLITKDFGLKVKAVVPVHLYGQMADMDQIVATADEFGLIVIEDACQAHGAEYFSKRKNGWVRAGASGYAAAFSFYPGKNLGACGEAGAVTTCNEEVAKTIKMIRDHGQAKKYYHDTEGYNGRLDAIQAGLLSVKLKYLESWNTSRRGLAKKYNDAFAESGAKVVTPFEPEWSRAVYHLYVIQVEDRDGLQKRLSAAGIGTGIHYPIPLHQQRAYASLGYKTGDFPAVEALASRILSLPMFPQMADEQLERVVDAVRSAIAPTSVAVAATIS
ncbi:MAG TPA: DegT/DnrJ/EryC1/StrS family aminotransferase [Terriglobales bacterium]|nr:DegT/DnrJ/EryC1/StrS family aminotransferase [Terriglobales bacterium]